MPDPAILRGLLVDFGGVLTTSVTRSFREFCEELGLPRKLVKETFLEAYDGLEEDHPVHRLETGKSTVEEFSGQLAEVLRERSGVAVDSDRLIERLFAGAALDERMLAGVLSARRGGVRTGLLSNSWGSGGYPRERFAELFDAVVISGEVGLRKPDPAIYLHAAAALGLKPAECVFVDDLDRNVKAADAVHMTGVLHRDAEETLPRLADLLGIDLPMEVC